MGVDERVEQNELGKDNKCDRRFCEARSSERALQRTVQQCIAVEIIAVAIPVHQRTSGGALRRVNCQRVSPSERVTDHWPAVTIVTVLGGEREVKVFGENVPLKAGHWFR